MKCIEYKELISACVDEMLSPQEEEKLMMHLKTCQACQKELEVLKQMQMMCHDMEEVSLPDSFHEDLMKRLKSESQVKSLAKFKFKWQYGGALVATMLVGVLFFNQLSMTSFKSESTSESAAIDQVTEGDTTMGAEPYIARSEVAEVKIQDESDSVAKKNQIESRASMLQDAGSENIWKVQVEDTEAFLEAIKEYLGAAQITYEQTEEGMSIYQVKNSHALMNWLQEHSYSFEGIEAIAESNIQLEIK